ncbi:MULTISPECIES: hypothetical protein [unclassified Lentimonas]|uniref:hypothetical protein n=1 Tax=unclassified Lentimonas TaxID=2630993 RepID=UPI001322EC8D|nr:MULTISPECIES: hypothetical protein [unclassified Lentimonas]CAA6680015.1 Unannotated [Lentimonas sp. CC4]CAA6687220.1 Unannotated [Lentimonas sp. CC6]CAA6696837.1 Unannotated [Lentimonas sp. CC10]CAA6697766.1 Unannotated [Lentimonas sp. CC19]CAA7071390.1 Unannotated [Lentimonas sp. CC11]
MKLNDAGELNNWVIELRDGSLLVQRHFCFEAQADVDTFIKHIGKFMRSPSLMVSINQKSISPATVVVSINLLPERVLLEAAGEIAKACEVEFASLTGELREVAA